MGVLVITALILLFLGGSFYAFYWAFKKDAEVTKKRIDKDLAERAAIIQDFDTLSGAIPAEHIPTLLRIQRYTFKEPIKEDPWDE